MIVVSTVSYLLLTRSSFMSQVLNQVYLAAATSRSIDNLILETNVPGPRM